MVKSLLWWKKDGCRSKPVTVCVAMILVSSTEVALTTLNKRQRQQTRVNPQRTLIGDYWSCDCTRLAQCRVNEKKKMFCDIFSISKNLFQFFYFKFRCFFITNLFIALFRFCLFWKLMETCLLTTS